MNIQDVDDLQKGDVIGKENGIKEGNHIAETEIGLGKVEDIPVFSYSVPDGISIPPHALP